MTSLLRKQFVNDVVSATILATCWHEVPLPPLEGNVINLRFLNFSLNCWDISWIYAFLLVLRSDSDALEPQP